MEILLKDKKITGITVDGSEDGSVEIGDVFQFFCAVLATVQVQGHAHLTIDNSPGSRVDLELRPREEN